jgi:predicted HicB family RNase H-like nuclease
MVGSTRSKAMNIMECDGYKARIEYDPELDQFRGEILAINGAADFYGKNTRELRSEFRKSLSVFLEVCEENGVEPRRAYSGKFNLRVSEELHERIAVRAAAEGVSLNSWVVGVLGESI